MTQNSITERQSILLILTAQNPSVSLVSYLSDLVSQIEFPILFINDGFQKDEFDKIFAPLIGQNKIEFLHHAIPLGEDQALKTGINHFLIHYPTTFIGIVTFNINDLYSVEDIFAVVKALRGNPETFCLGVDKKTQARLSKPWVGKKIAGYAFRLTTGYTFSDFQSSLIGIPSRYLRFLLQKKDAGQGMKLDLLVHTTRNRHVIYEVPITLSTEVYKRFDPLRDSIKISFVFLRFIALSSLTALIDYFVFILAYRVTGSIFASMVIARMIAGTYNFIFGSRWVFRSTQNPGQRALKYALLVIILMLMSYGLLTPLVTYLNINPYLSKAIAEAAIFLLSFAAQAIFVYSPESAITERSDWTKYYDAPFPTSTVTRRLTEGLLLRVMRRYHPEPVQHIYEIGGANSCFFDGLARQYPQADYTILDNNQRGLDLFRQRVPNNHKVFLHNQDVLHMSAASSDADIVFSVGLIEHFNQVDTSRAIRAHFGCARPGAIVILTFPTPTLLYRVARRIAELLKLWHFPDERPLTKREVINEAQKFGKVVYSTINWGVIFTQAVVVISVEKK